MCFTSTVKQMDFCCLKSAESGWLRVGLRKTGDWASVQGWWEKGPKGKFQKQTSWGEENVEIEHRFPGPVE